MLKLRKNKKGFTLVELIVVIAIMAVLAGVVAGVTVSQLNKQTDKTMATEAKKIADSIYAELVQGEATAAAETADPIKTALDAAYGKAFTWSDSNSAPADNNDNKGKIFVWKATAGEYHVKYFGKQANGGDVEYTVTEMYGVQKGSTAAGTQTGGGTGTPGGGTGTPGGGTGTTDSGKVTQ